MKLEILERSGHIEGWQPTSLTPQHTKICSHWSQGSVTEHNSQTWHKKGKECHILGSDPQKPGQRERSDLCHDPSRTACHRQEISSPVMEFPCPLTLTNKAVCTQRPHEREGVKLISTSQEMVLLVPFIHPLQFVPEETSATSEASIHFYSSSRLKVSTSLTGGFQDNKRNELALSDWQRIWKPRNPSLLLPTTLTAMKSHINPVGPTLYIQLVYCLSNKDNSSYK